MKSIKKVMTIKQQYSVPVLYILDKSDDIQKDSIFNVLYRPTARTRKKNKKASD